MIKLLQKYKMYVLVVAGVLIMVAFLLGDVLRQINTFSRSTTRMYTVGGEKVTAQDVQTAAVHVEGLRRVFNGDVIFRQRGLDDTAEQWQLVSMAAERAGMYGGPVDGRAMAQRQATAAFMQQYGTSQIGGVDWRQNLMTRESLTADQVDARVAQLAETFMANASRGGTDPNDGPMAMAELRSVERLMQSYLRVPQTSEMRLAADARRLLDVGVAKIVYVPVSDAAISAAPAPTEQELLAQFDKYKDVLVGSGTDGIGYKQGDRIRYSWFAIDQNAISKAVQVDPVEIQKRAQARAATGTDPSTLRKQIESEIRGELTRTAVDEATSAVRAEFLRSIATLPEKEGYRVLPPDWKKPDLRAAADAMVKRLAGRGITIATPVVSTSASAQDAATFVREKGIGTTLAVRPNNKFVLARDALFGAKEFGKPAGQIPVQVGLPIATAFTGFDGSLHFVMLEEAIVSAAPTSLDQVRAEVEKDLRRMKAVAILQESVDKQLPAIAELGMNEAVRVLATFGYPDAKVRDALAQRMSAKRGSGIANEKGEPLEGELQDDVLVEAIMSRAGTIDPASKVEQSTAPARTFAVPVGKGRGFVIGQVTGLRPLTRETFEIIMGSPEVRAQIEGESMAIERNIAPFKTEQLIERMGVTGLLIDKNKQEAPAN